jgi:thiamine phosphate synthase YjbQ (UPF0047 family)
LGIGNRKEEKISPIYHLIQVETEIGIGIYNITPQIVEYLKLSKIQSGE